ncbi:MAG: hypothetical protein JXA74_18335 [Anaerolineae bacterium]|nr:hypothetical protein [Anaerolineae bacterium]
MRCEEICQQLAIYRELPPGERADVDRHLDRCPVCLAAKERYQAQDQILAALEEIAPSREWAAQVLDQTVRRPSRAPLRWGWARALAMVVAALVILTLGTFGASAQALPGGGLYPVKRALERARLNLTRDEARRLEYMQELAERRRQEVRAVVEGDRSAEVQFQGELESSHDSFWIVDGIEVEVGAQAIELGPSLVGQVVSIMAQVEEGHIRASDIRVQQVPGPTPTASSAVPTATPTAAPVTATARPTSTAMPTATQTSSPYPSPTATATPRIYLALTTPDAHATRVHELRQTVWAAVRLPTPTPPPQVTPWPTGELPALPDVLPTWWPTGVPWPTDWPALAGTVSAEMQTRIAEYADQMGWHNWPQAGGTPHPWPSMPAIVVPTGLPDLPIPPIQPPSGESPWPSWPGGGEDDEEGGGWPGP